MEYLWLAVTPDEYELPLVIADTSVELAEKLGTNANSVVSSVSKKLSGKNIGRKIIRIKI